MRPSTKRYVERVVDSQELSTFPHTDTSPMLTPPPNGYQNVTEWDEANEYYDTLLSVRELQLQLQMTQP